MDAPDNAAFRHEDPEAASAESALDDFERDIEGHDQILYGIALFYEGISLLYAGQPALVETYRKQFRNIIQTGQAAAQHARELLESARRNPANAAALGQFAFHPGEGHANPPALVRRAMAMVESYEALFPGRPRDQALSEEETLQLMDAAAQRLGGAMVLDDETA